MLCSISGTVPEEPVFSLKSGHVYEKRLVLKHVATGGTEPVTGEACTPDDFVSVKSNAAIRPKPIAATSISGLLGTLQSEWDGLMLETFQMRQALEATRQELSQALYQHDAACRVIARVVKERDQARATLTSSQAALAQRAAASGATGGADVDMNGGAGAASTDASAPEGLTQETLQMFIDKYKDLTKWRKKRPIPAETATPADVSALSRSASFTPHSPSTPGITCLELSRPSGPFSGLALTGGVDKVALLFDVGAGRVVGRLQGHGKAVTGAAFSAVDREALLTSSADGHVRVWVPSSGSREEWASAVTLRVGRDCVGVSSLPGGDYAVSAGRDGSVTLMDTGAGRVLVHIPPPSDSLTLHAVRAHPDGLLVGTAASDGLRFTDLRTQAVAAIVTNAPHGGKAITCLAFSENGYVCASGGEDGSAVTWDLRKVGAAAEPVVRKYALTVAQAGAIAGAGGVTALAFDNSGHYLGVGAGNGVVACWDVRGPSEGPVPAPLRMTQEHTGSVTGLAWGALGKSLVTVSMDRAMHVMSVTQ